VLTAHHTAEYDLPRPGILCPLYCSLPVGYLICDEGKSALRQILTIILMLSDGFFSLQTLSPTSASLLLYEMPKAAVRQHKTHFDITQIRL